MLHIYLWPAKRPKKSSNYYNKFHIRFDQVCLKCLYFYINCFVSSMESVSLNNTVSWACFCSIWTGSILRRHWLLRGWNGLYDRCGLYSLACLRGWEEKRAVYALSQFKIPVSRWSGARMAPKTPSTVVWKKAMFSSNGPQTMWILIIRATRL